MTDSDAEAVRRLRAAGCVFAEDEVALLRGEFGGELGGQPEFEAALSRRERGEPLEQIVGWAEFDGRRVKVVPGVFVPRLRSTALLSAVDRLIAQGAFALSPESAVLDLCCGTGSLGAGVLHRYPGIDLVAADIDPDAARCARLNLGDRGAVVTGDLFDAVPPRYRGRFALIVVNAPYVPTERIADMPREARDHEHTVALDGGADGLDLHRRIGTEAADWVRPGGLVALETSRGQAERSASAFPAAYFETGVAHDDEVGGTVVLARRRVAAI